MTIVVQIPKIKKLECSPDGKVSKKDLDAYFRNIARTTSRLKLSVVGLRLDDECSLAVIAAAIAIEELVKKTTDPVTTKPFDKLKSAELEAKYRARELGKDIEEYFKKKIAEILLDITNALGLLNPFNLPIPFLGTVTLIDENGNPYEYRPKIQDLFTKEGQKKVKAAIKEDIDSVKKFFKELESVFDGSLGIKSPDLAAEEAWHKVKNWFSQLINDFIGSVGKAIAKIVKSIPIIGKPIYDLVMAAIDPTITVEEAFDKIVAEYKAKIKKAKEDLLSGKILEDIAEKLIEEAIEKILNIPIPLVGTLGALIGVGVIGKDILMKEALFHDIEDAFKEAIQKARRFFQGGILVKIYDIIAKAPAYILSQFPIVGKIFKTLKKVVDLLSGKNPLTECDVLNIIFPAIFSLSVLVENLLPSCVEVIFIE